MFSTTTTLNTLLLYWNYFKSFLHPILLNCCRHTEQALTLPTRQTETPFYGSTTWRLRKSKNSIEFKCVSPNLKKFTPPALYNDAVFFSFTLNFLTSSWAKVFQTLIALKAYSPTMMIIKHEQLWVVLLLPIEEEEGKKI